MPDMVYDFARLPDALNHMDFWKQINILPDGIVILGATIHKVSNYYNRMQKWLEGFAGIVFLVFGAKLVFANK